MKKITKLFPFLAAFLMLSLSSCDFIGDVFEAGFWTAIIVVIIVVMLAIWLIRKLFG